MNIAEQIAQKSQALLDELLKLPPDQQRALIVERVCHSAREGAPVRFLVKQLGLDPSQTIPFHGKDERSGNGLADLIIPALPTERQNLPVSPIELPPSNVGHSDRIRFMELCQTLEKELGVSPKEDIWWANATIEQIETYKKYLSGEEYGETSGNDDTHPAEDSSALLSFLPETVTKDVTCLGTATLINERRNVDELMSLLSWDEVKKLKHRTRPSHPDGTKLPSTRLDESMKRLFLEALVHYMETSGGEEAVKTSPPTRKRAIRAPSTEPPRTYDAPDPSVEVDPYDVLFPLYEGLQELELEMNEKGNELRGAIDAYNRVEGRVLETLFKIRKVLPSVLEKLK